MHNSAEIGFKKVFCLWPNFIDRINLSGGRIDRMCPHASDCFDCGFVKCPKVVWRQGDQIGRFFPTYGAYEAVFRKMQKQQTLWEQLLPQYISILTKMSLAKFQTIFFKKIHLVTLFEIYTWQNVIESVKHVCNQCSQHQRIVHRLSLVRVTTSGYCFSFFKYRSSAIFESIFSTVPIMN
jgi:hypothetical protein